MDRLSPSPLKAENVVLSYRLNGAGGSEVLHIDAFSAQPGAAVAVTGPSGSGKTSLLFVLSGLERPQKGRIFWGDTDIAALNEGRRDRWRRRTIGFVFQDFHLFPGLSALSNVLIPATFDAVRPTSALRDRARTLLDQVGLADISNRKVETMSRGEMQRVAVARALLFNPPIIMADEPTASLDAENGAAVGALIREMAREAGSTLIVVSHDPKLLGVFPLVYRLVNGRLTVPEARSW